MATSLWPTGLGGKAGQTLPAPVTGGRRLRARFNVPMKALSEEAFGYVHHFSDIARNSQEPCSHTVLLDGLGWMLKAFQLNLSYAFERVEAAGGILKSIGDGGTLVLPSGFGSVLMQRAPTEPGVTTGASLNLQVAGDSHYAKNIQAGTVWDDIAKYILHVDQVAYPSPQVCGDDTIAMDRVVLDTNQHWPNSPIIFRFTTPGAHSLIPHKIANLFFVGPAGIDQIFYGIGEYCLELWGDGQAYLMERRRRGLAVAPGLAPLAWAAVDNFRWCEPARVMGSAHMIRVSPHLYPHARNQTSGVIHFGFEAGTEGLPRSKRVGYAQRGAVIDSHVYNAPYSGPPRTNPKTPPPPNPPATSRQPLRVDVRRDLNAMPIQLAVPVYPTTSYVLDDVFSLRSPPTHGEPIRVEWYGYVDGAAGCSLDVALYDVSGATPDFDADPGITASGGGPIGTDGNAGFRTFIPPNPTHMDYQVKVIKTGPGITAPLTGPHIATPILEEIRVVKQPVYDTVAPGETVADSLMKVQINGPESDLTHETASFTIEDPVDSLALLRTRGSIPTIVDTTYPADPLSPSSPIDWTNPANEGKQSVLTKGFIENVTALKRGRFIQSGLGSAIASLFPSLRWRRYECDHLGEWLRASEQIATFVWNFGVDPNYPSTVVPYKVTDALAAIFGWMGYAPEEINIGVGTQWDLPMRFFPKNNDDGGLTIQVGANLLDVAMRFAIDFLGLALARDDNAGLGSDATHWPGMWTLIKPQRPPYNNLAYFTGSGPGVIGGGGLRLPHMEGAYPPMAGAGGQPIVGEPIYQQFRSRVRRPGANHIVVIGTGDLDGANNRAPDQLTQSWINFKSYDPIGSHPTADPTHPDYLGRRIPLLYVDANLPSQDAVNWVCARLADLVGHGQKMLDLIAPLALVRDINDPVAKRPRKLRYYDPVLVWNDETQEFAQFLVRNVSPIVEKHDEIQLAYYQLESPPDLST